MLGTYTTLDTPCLEGQGAGITPSKEQIKLITHAKIYLTDLFGEIGGRVRIKQNSHEFGAYPSFEIDLPEHLEDIDIDIDCDCGTCEECLNAMEKDEWNEKANEIEDKYGKMFEEYL